MPLNNSARRKCDEGTELLVEEYNPCYEYSRYRRNTKVEPVQDHLPINLNEGEQEP